MQIANFRPWNLSKDFVRDTNCVSEKGRLKYFNLFIVAGTVGAQIYTTASRLQQPEVISMRFVCRFQLPHGNGCY